MVVAGTEHGSNPAPRRTDCGFGIARQTSGGGGSRGFGRSRGQRMRGSRVKRNEIWRNGNRLWFRNGFRIIFAVRPSSGLPLFRVYSTAVKDQSPLL